MHKRNQKISQAEHIITQKLTTNQRILRWALFLRVLGTTDIITDTHSYMLQNQPLCSITQVLSNYDISTGAYMCTYILQVYSTLYMYLQSRAPSTLALFV